jgi:prefoldin subunit 5
MLFRRNKIAEAQEQAKKVIQVLETQEKQLTVQGERVERQIGDLAQQATQLTQLIARLETEKGQLSYQLEVMKSQASQLIHQLDRVDRLKEELRSLIGPTGVVKEVSLN